MTAAHGRASSVGEVTQEGKDDFTTSRLVRSIGLAMYINLALDLQTF